MILMFSGLVKHSKTKTKPYVLTTYNTHIYMWSVDLKNCKFMGMN